MVIKNFRKGILYSSIMIAFACSSTQQQQDQDLALEQDGQEMSQEDEYSQQDEANVNSNESSYDVNEDGMLDGVDYNFAGECLQNNIAATVGKYLIATAASPYVRSAPLILIVFSSAAVLLIWDAKNPP